jgi:imidazolonepropionase-like amidohydrolase
LKLPVVGHIPERGKGITDAFFQPGFGLVAHAEEFAQQTDQPNEAAIPNYVAMMKRNGTALIATLSLDERIAEEMRDPSSLKSRDEMIYLAPPLYPIVLDHNPYVAQSSPGEIAYFQSIIRFNRKLVAACVDAGVTVLAGTDSPVPGLVPGFALHDELEAMASAGMTRREVLEGATRLAAQRLGVLGDRGTVEIGKRADLLLLDADPLADIANARRIAAVIIDGRYVSRADLDTMMRDLARRNREAQLH